MSGMDAQRDSAIIDRIGRKLIMEHFGISRQAVHHWCKNGIPDRHRNSVAMLSNSKRDKARLAEERNDKWFANRNIYAIVDAEDRVRYVGKTHKEPMARAADHIRSRSRVGEWMRNNLWSVRTLQIATAAFASTCERQWIEKMHREGQPLFNRHCLPVEKAK